MTDFYTATVAFCTSLGGITFIAIFVGAVAWEMWGQW